MVSCKLAEFLYDLIPLAGMRSILLRLHMEGCPRCERTLVNRDQARALFVGPKILDSDGTVWRKIRARRVEEERAGERRRGPRGRRLGWEWASGIAGALFLAVASFWLLRSVGTNGTGYDPILSVDRFEIESISVGGAPAQAYVYQPGNTDMILVWAEKTDQGG